ncbi:phosphotransferase family protein [Modestobacter sp. Leaf380]|uniref:phosphotransferase family protein n=1 Tax=Modestobacter sp. Leaf380 TaxID=1736356 RepID=UPI0006F57523|nr:phosphotransferase family protein [Modestobacter sp. Leaf380]KQS68637.1 acyl-CoA dehydrogenase [Modestobacter sp. Leaf380]
MQDPPGVDVAALQRWLDAAVPGLLQGPLRVTLLAGGRSNLTYALTDGVGRWVLRRPPLGHVRATAHDVAREHRVLGALAGTAVPVPRPVALAGPEVLGAPCYVMEFADGVVLREADQLHAVDGDAAAGALVDVLVALHRVDPEAVGLGDLGRPAGYLERQVARWSGQLEAGDLREVPGLAELGRRLGARVPVGGPAAVVHGDYRLDNVVVTADRRPDVVAVLDWEMATLGDPLADLASTLVWWDGMAGLDSPVAAVPGDVPGWPDGGSLAAAYGRAAGADLAELPWYLGLAFFKIAVIFEQIHSRSVAGLTVGEGFDRLGAVVPALVERGHAAS